MPKKSVCIKIPKLYGEETIVLTSKLQIINRGLEIQKDKTSIYIPLIRQPQEKESAELKEKVPKYTISTYMFPERGKQATVAELLEEKLPSHLLSSLPRAIDFVGDIAIIEIPPELTDFRNIIGEAVLAVHKRVRTVLAKVGAISGTHRVRKFSIIAGEPRTETIHKEHGCRFQVDLAKVYFSPRLSHEHNRIASLVKEDEIVIDFFASVGPFAILIAKTHERVKVHAIDINPHAFEFLEKNIRFNRVQGKVNPVFGDAEQVVKERFVGVADRVIMNLPEKAIKFVDAACEALKPIGGVVHFYSFVRASGSFEKTKRRFSKAVKESGREVKRILFSKFVRATAPYEWQTVLDAEIH